VTRRRAIPHEQCLLCAIRLYSIDDKFFPDFELALEKHESKGSVMRYHFIDILLLLFSCLECSAWCVVMMCACFTRSIYH
jgi:hypothetical protein